MQVLSEPSTQYECTTWNRPQNLTTPNKKLKTHHSDAGYAAHKHHVPHTSGERKIMKKMCMEMEIVKCRSQTIDENNKKKKKRNRMRVHMYRQHPCVEKLKKKNKKKKRRDEEKHSPVKAQQYKFTKRVGNTVLLLPWQFPLHICYINFSCSVCSRTLSRASSEHWFYLFVYVLRNPHSHYY